MDTTLLTLDLLAVAVFVVVNPIVFSVIMLTGPIDVLFLCACFAVYTALAALVAGISIMYQTLRCGVKGRARPFSPSWLILYYSASCYVTGIIAILLGQQSGLTIQAWQTISLIVLAPPAFLVGALGGFVLFRLQRPKADSDSESESH